MSGCRRLALAALASPLARPPASPPVPNDVSIKAGRGNLIARRHLQEINASCANERIRTPFEAPLSGGGHQEGVRGDEEFFLKPFLAAAAVAVDQSTTGQLWLNDRLLALRLTDRR